MISFESEHISGRRCDMKKPTLPSELVYILANLTLSLAVAMLTAADFGISMIVAPAYILSQKLGFLTFGQSEYVIQALLFIVLCLLMKKVKPAYFSSFVTCLLYGAALDGWRAVIPLFNPAVTAPGSMGLPLRLFLFVAGELLTAFSVAVFFYTYLHPQVYDFFVKAITARFDLDRTRFKILFDFGCLVVGCVMTLLLFGRFVGIGVGTLIMTLVNGWLIGKCGGWLEKHITLKPLLPKLAAHFELSD